MPVDIGQPVVVAGLVSSTIDPADSNAIELLEQRTVRVMLRDNTVLQGRLERIGWINPDSKAISYLCLKLDSDSLYVLAAQGMSTCSGLLFIPWDWISWVVVP